MLRPCSNLSVALSTKLLRQVLVVTELTRPHCPKEDHRLPFLLKLTLEYTIKTIFSIQNQVT